MVIMAKISIYLDDRQLEEIDQLINDNPHITNHSRSALISYLIEQEITKNKKQKMLEAAKLIDELDLGWSEEEQTCAIIDLEVSG